MAQDTSKITVKEKVGYAFGDAATMLGLSAAEIELFAPAMGPPDMRSDSGPLQMADQ